MCTVLLWWRFYALQDSKQIHIILPYISVTDDAAEKKQMFSEARLMQSSYLWTMYIL